MKLKSLLIGLIVSVSAFSQSDSDIIWIDSTNNPFRKTDTIEAVMLVVDTSWVGCWFCCGSKFFFTSGYVVGNPGVTLEGRSGMPIFLDDKKRRFDPKWIVWIYKVL